jgi:hypothetical protein
MHRITHRTVRFALLLFWGSLVTGSTAFSQGQPAAPEALIGIGFGAGFPAYQSASAELQVQAGSFGVAARAAFGSVGVAGGLQARGYLPLPLGVPHFVGVGIDAYAGDIAPHVVFGLHLPLNEAWRFDLEGGAAYPIIDTNRRWVPYVRAGISLTFLAQGAPANRSGGPLTPTGSGSSCVVSAPDEGLIPASIASEIATLERRYTAIYGSLYRDLNYSSSIAAVNTSDRFATVKLDYAGSVVQRINGVLLEASGRAEVDLVWRSCRWVRTDLRY